MLRSEYLGPQNWTEITEWGMLGEIAWQFQVENGTAYAGSYVGNHYGLKLGGMNLFLNKTTDGVNWEPIDSNH